MNDFEILQTILDEIKELKHDIKGIKEDVKEIKQDVQVLSARVDPFVNHNKKR